MDAGPPSIRILILMAEDPQVSKFPFLQLGEAPKGECRSVDVVSIRGVESTPALRTWRRGGGRSCAGREPTSGDLKEGAVGMRT